MPSSRCLVVIAAAMCALSVAGRGHGAQRPNVIVIMADDLGYADVGFNGSEEIRTPWIDQIAARGVRCTAGYVTHPVCSPSRAGMLAGRYQQRFGHERNPIFAPDDPNMGLPLDQQTLADVLGGAGYRSSVIGKWHLGAHEVHHPLNRGFDFFYGMLGGGHHYFPHLLTVDNPVTHSQEYKSRLLRDWERVEETEYLTDAFSREAVDFIERNVERPFFLYLSYNAPHTPMQATPEYLARYPGIENEKRRTYAAMVSAVDDGVGRVLQTLEQLDINEQTLVFFLSDNGGPTYANASNNQPLRGVKGNVYEGGVRVPFAARWDGVLPAGVDYDSPVSSLDIFATAISLAGADPPSGQSLDGVDLIPYLMGANPESPHEALFWRVEPRGRYGARIGEMKLAEQTSGQPELFDLKADLGEKRDLSGSAPDALGRLKAARDAWESGLVEPKFLGLQHREQYAEQRTRGADKGKRL